MSLDWCPGIREACGHWRDAPMLQQTFEALECTLDQDNDACIDCAKAVVESACQIIMTSFHSSQNPLRPVTETPTLSEWLSAAVKALKLGDVRDDKFKKLVSSHHRRSAVLAADAIVDCIACLRGDGASVRLQPGGAGTERDPCCGGPAGTWA